MDYDICTHTERVNKLPEAIRSIMELTHPERSTLMKEIETLEKEFKVAVQKDDTVGLYSKQREEGIKALSFLEELKNGDTYYLAVQLVTAKDRQEELNAELDKFKTISGFMGAFTIFLVVTVVFLAFLIKKLKAVIGRTPKRDSGLTNDIKAKQVPAENNV